MGLSASQGRLLSLTSRMSDLELQAQTISNSKIRLSQESAQASDAYNAALDKKTIKAYSADTKSYVNATASNLTTYGAISGDYKQKFIKDAAGRVITDQRTADIYKQVYAWNMDNRGEVDKTGGLTFCDSLLGYYNEDTFNSQANADKTAGKSYDQSKVDYYIKLFNEMVESGGCNAQSSDNLNSSEWLESQVDCGNLFLYEYNSTGGTNGTGDFVNVSWTSGDASLQTVSDNTTTAKAEAVYEATMADIQTKDKKFDLELKNIDTEHTAIQTEVDTVKKVIDKNIERGFKIFNA